MRLFIDSVEQNKDFNALQFVISDEEKIESNQTLITTTQVLVNLLHQHKVNKNILVTGPSIENKLEFKILKEFFLVLKLQNYNLFLEDVCKKYPTRYKHIYQNVNFIAIN